MASVQGVAALAADQWAEGHHGDPILTGTSAAETAAQDPLPALVHLADGRWVVLAQCDGQRVLFQDAGAQPGTTGGRPTIEPLEVVATQWTDGLIVVTSRASLGGELAGFDFSWFIRGLVKHRRLLGEALVVSLFLQLLALVSPLSADAVNDEKRGAIFPVTLKLAQAHLNVEGKRIALAPGMNLSAEIKTGMRRVIEYLLSPMQQAASESLKER